MKPLNYIICIFVSLLLFSCTKNSHIPNTSILEELSPSELSQALKAEDGKNFPRGKFEDIYPGVRKQLETMSEIDKAKVANLTYRELITAMDVMTDTIAEKQILQEWQDMYDSHIEEAKNLASQMTVDLSRDIRISYTRASMYGGYTPTIADCARRSSFYQYLARVPVTLWEVENCWDYNRIIKGKIDPNFDSQQEFRSKKQLARIEKDYPEAHYFLSIHEERVNRLYRDMQNLMR